jgi:fructose-1,6-bisphosphatase/inositol monophosphatase family enzyme
MERISLAIERHGIDLSRFGSHREGLDFAINLAHTAGRYLKEVQSDPKQVREKEDGTLISDADKTVSEFLTGEIKRKFPEHLIIDEERPNNSRKIYSEFCWFTDPLDNTRPYLSGNPHYAVLICLTKDFLPVLGVVSKPSLEELLFSVRGKGAFLKQGEENPKRIYTNPGSSRIYTNFEDIKELEKLLGNQGFSVEKGNTLNALDVATGNAQAFIGKINGGALWDVAAPSLCVKETGGFMTTLSGEDFDFSQKDHKCKKGILAHAGSITEDLRKEILNSN